MAALLMFVHTLKLAELQSSERAWKGAMQQRVGVPT